MMILGYLLPARLVQGVLSVLAVVGVLSIWIVTHDAKVVEKERVRVATHGAKTNAKAHAARRAVPPTGAAARLRENYCRDC